MTLTNKAYNADCMDWLRSYDGDPIKLVVTDPPYLLPSWTGGGFMDESKKGWIATMDVDNLSRGYDIAEFAELINKVQGGAINVYFFCNKLQIPDYFDIYIGKYGCKFDILTWHKDNAMPTFNGKYLTDTEYILYFRNRGGCDPKSYEDAKTWWIQPINQRDKKRWRHPTIKPLNIVRTLIRNSSSAGDLVCDPFLGSGTTRVAAYFEGRSFVGCELDEGWYETQERRFDEECRGVLRVNNEDIEQPNLFDNA